MKQKRHKNLNSFAKSLGLDPARAAEAEVKAKLTNALIKEMDRQGFTHQEVADMAGVSRTTVTGIVNGSLQRVTVDRLLKILGAIGLSVEVKVKRSA